MTPPKNKLIRWFFFRSRDDSPFMKTVIHITLVLVAIIMIYPALRVVTVSLRSGDRLLNTSMDLIPTAHLKVPNGFTEAQLNVFKERPFEDVIVDGRVVERGIKSEIAIANRINRGKDTELRTIKLPFSNKEIQLEVYKGITDRELNQVFFRDERKIQELMDAEISKKFTFVQGEIVFSEDDRRPIELPTGFSTDLLRKIVSQQISNNIYSGRIPPDWQDLLTNTDRQKMLTEKWALNEEKRASTDVNIRASVDPIIDMQFNQMEGVKREMKDGTIVLENEEVKLILPYNLDIRSLQTELMYALEDAQVISYWTATMGNYIDVLTQKDFILWIWNSLLITVSTSFLGVALSSTGAYAFSRFDFPGRKAGLIFLLTTQMIPAGMLILPIFILASALNLAGQWSGLVVAYSVSSIPFSIWILKGYYDTIPKELEEAATIDGATKMQTFFKIMLPLAAPALAIVFLFNFMAAWNDFLLAKVMLTDQAKYTWTLGLRQLQGARDTAWGPFSAAALMVSVPVMILFLSSSKYLVGGLTLGSVKG